MNIHITGRHFQVSNRLRKHIEKEAEKLERLSDRITDCQVTVAAERENKLVEVVVNVHAHTLMASGSATGVYQSVEGAMERAKVQLKKLQGKLQARRRTGGKPVAVEA